MYMYIVLENLSSIHFIIPDGKFSHNTLVLKTNVLLIKYYLREGGRKSAGVFSRLVDRRDFLLLVSLRGVS